MSSSKLPGCCGIILLGCLFLASAAVATERCVLVELFTSTF